MTTEKKSKLVLNSVVLNSIDSVQMNLPGYSRFRYSLLLDMV